MFTGLVQAIGRLEPAPRGVWVRELRDNLGPLRLGDSVAVDGVCLTVVEMDPAAGGFRADASEETLSRTTLGTKARAQALVNLEPALRLSDRLGGHLVSGHVDGQGTVRAIEPLASSWHLSIRWQDPRHGRYVCEKGSITVDGISLTVAGCEESGAGFWLAVIPHTWSQTTLQYRRVGDAVNLEADLVARYLERLVGSPPVAGEPPAPTLTVPWLADHGWA